MPSPLRDALRERLTAKNAAGWAVVLAILWHLAEGATAQFATTVSSVLVYALLDLLADAYDLRESVTNLGFAAYVLASGTGLFLFGEGPLWAPFALFAVGGWVALDVLQTVRHEGATVDDDSRDGREVYRDYVARRVHETLDERPRTRRELFDALDAGDEDVAAALDRLEERGVVDRTGSEYRVADSESDSGPARVLDWTRSALARVARPVTLELRDHESGSESEPGEPVGRSDAVSGSEAGRVGSDPEASTDSRDRELDVEGRR